MAVGYRAQHEAVTVGATLIKGILTAPDTARGIVIFADGGKDAAHDPRNVKAAAALQARRFATLMLELLSEHAGRGQSDRLATDLQCAHIVEAIDCAANDPRTATLPVGLVGCGSAAAPALCAAALRPDRVSTIVLRDGGSHMIGRDIGLVRAPTLLIVGELDRELAGSKEAYHRLTCLKQLEIIPRATHAYSHKRDLERMISAAVQWFDLYLIPRSAVAASAAGRRRDAPTQP